MVQIRRKPLKMIRDDQIEAIQEVVGIYHSKIASPLEDMDLVIISSRFQIAPMEMN